MQVAVLLYPGVAALELIGPCAILSRLPQAEFVFVAEALDPVLTDLDPLRINPTNLLEDVTAPDTLFVPGGPGIEPLLVRSDLTRWLRDVHLSARSTLTCGSGSLLLGAAGVLGDLSVTTYARELHRLNEYGAHARSGPVVEHERVSSAAGALPAIDMALRFASRRAGLPAGRAIRDGLAFGEERATLTLVPPPLDDERRDPRL